MENAIDKAMKSVQKERKKAEKCHIRPLFHFRPIARWMNDPNGTIFFKGEYHLFYQFNPYGNHWGHMHWGHAKSKDLIHWSHLPIALAPSKKLGEHHCFSGCCVINNGTPTILYTKIGKIVDVIKGAEQWQAISEDNLLTWEKYQNNPILTEKIHLPEKIRHWRDPYVWQDAQDNFWYMILAGHYESDPHGMVFLYKSKNLQNWDYVGILCEGERKKERGWECPNFFKFENDTHNRYMLLISPYEEVRYAIGKYQENKFQPDQWHTFDHGKCYYATNTYKNAKNQMIVVGWIKKGGNGGWNGCLSIPRIISLEKNLELTIKPLPELTRLRELSIYDQKHIRFSDEIAKSTIIHGNLIEIDATITSSNQSIIGFRIGDDKSEIPIQINIKEKFISVANESGIFEHTIKVKDNNPEINFHIFIDRSVIEVFLDHQEVITARFYPKLKKQKELKITPIIPSNDSGKLILSAWKIKPIWEK